ncbi:MAG: NAD-dependent epimerase/dehydratase family protein [Promethearchaeota archaeon]
MSRKILLTGAFGLVGSQVLKELVNRDYDVRVLEVKSARNQRVARKYKDLVDLVWGDLRDAVTVERAVKGREVVLHIAAIIPPLADKKPEFARSVNVGGTANVLAAIEKQPVKPRLVYTSSVAVYGDRLEDPMIYVADPLKPNDDDEYAKQKVEAEALIRAAAEDWGLEFAIFRLSYIASPEKLQMDPLMFEMPLATKIEICNAKDAGLALANAVECDELLGGTFHLAGGTHCRTTYREYLDEMMDIFGLGRDCLPEDAFSKGEFHCGWMDTRESQRLLRYQRHSLKYYYDKVREKVGIRSFFTKMVKPVAVKYLLAKSPYHQ